MNSYFQQKMLLAIEKGNTTEINSCLKELTNIQNEMARISNEFDKSKARTFLLNKITQLQEFGKTVYKYKEFINHGMIEEFKNEFENINSLIANGALDEITYQWQTEPNACKTCRDLNGKEFYNAKDVPNKPHPNCKCILKVKAEHSILLGVTKLEKQKAMLDKAILCATPLLKQASKLWEISSTKFEAGEDYINENGALYDSINNIANEKIRNYVHDYIQKQYDADDSKGIVFHHQSTLAQKIMHSNAFKNYIKKNKPKFVPNTTFPDTTVAFEYPDFDLYFAIHRASVINIKIDDKNNFCAIVVDTYDFNKNSSNNIVRKAYSLQKNNLIENYFIIVNIVIPKEIWNKY